MSTCILHHCIQMLVMCWVKHKRRATLISSAWLSTCAESSRIRLCRGSAAFSAWSARCLSLVTSRPILSLSALQGIKAHICQPVGVLSDELEEHQQYMHVESNIKEGAGGQECAPQLVVAVAQPVELLHLLHQDCMILLGAGTLPCALRLAGHLRFGSFCCADSNGRIVSNSSGFLLGQLQLRRQNVLPASQVRHDLGQLPTATCMLSPQCSFNPLATRRAPQALPPSPRVGKEVSGQAAKQHLN